MKGTDITQPGRSRERGLSLVELMVGIVAIVTVLGSIISMSIQQSHLRQYDQEVYLAFLASKSTMEELRGLPFSQVLARDGAGFDAADLGGKPGGLKPVPGNLSGLPGKITVVVDQSGGGETLYMITLTVTWTGCAKQSTFKMRALRAERKVS